MIRKICMDSFPKPLSSVCFGCAKLGSSFDENLSFEMLDHYYAMGGRFLDTANVYGRWGSTGLNESERVIGKWLKERQVTDMVITSKCVHYTPGDPNTSRVNRDDALRDFDISRSALGIDVIPIYLTHRDDPAKDIREIVDFMVEMVMSQKIIRFGLSNYTAERVEGALRYLGEDWKKYMVGVSNEWSLAEEGCENYTPKNGMVATDRALWHLHCEKDLPLFAFSAAAKGFFSKLQFSGATVADDTIIGGYGIDQKMLTTRNAQSYEELCEISAHTGVNVNAISVAYVLNCKIPAIPIVSVSSKSQMDDFDAISSWDMDLTHLSKFAK